VRSWEFSAITAGRRRDVVFRVALAVVILGGLLWALPIRRPGESGGHHAAHESTLDPFEKAGVTELKEGQRGPAFTLATLPGGQASLADHAGRLVILNFWATWCGPCDAEMPTLQALWDQYRARGLLVVGVSVDRASPQHVLEPYVRHKRLTFPIWLDPDMKAAQAWRVRGVPATFLVRPGGDVAGMVMGAREWDSAEMRALIERLLPGGHGKVGTTRGHHVVAFALPALEH
jgi:peroxiredoxin